MSLITFTHLSVRNTLSFRELEFSLLDNRLTIIVGRNKDHEGSNGAGKSTIPKLLLYGLTGYLPDGRQGNAVLSDFNPTDSKVVISFETDNKKYEITRYRKDSKYKDKLILKQESNNLTRTKNPETQKEIYNILKLSREGLLLLILLSTDTIKFASSTPTERRKLFTQLFPALHRYEQEFAPKFKIARDTVTEQKVKQEKDLADVTTKETMLVERIQTLTQKLEENKEEVIKKQLETKIKELKNDLVKLQTNYDSFLLSSKVKVVEPSVLARMKKKVQFLEQTLSKDTGEYELQTIEERNLSNRKIRLTTSLERDKAEYKKAIDSIKNKRCSFCGHVLERKDLPKASVENIKQLKTTIIENNKELQEVKVGEASLSKIQQELKVAINTNKARVDKGRTLVATLDLLTDKRNLISNMEIRIMQEEAKLENIEEKTGYINTEKVETEKELEKIKAQYTVIYNKINKIEYNYNLLDYLYKISVKDLPTYLLNSYLITLEKEASDILATLFSGMKIHLNDTGQTKKGVSKPELSIMIENNFGIQKVYESFSGGEKQAIDISLLFGIQRLVTQKEGLHTNILFLDEILDLSSDEIRTGNTLDFLYQETNNYDTFGVISHKTIMTEQADTYFEVIKQNGISELVRS